MLLFIFLLLRLLLHMTQQICETFKYFALSIYFNDPFNDDTLRIQSFLITFSRKRGRQLHKNKLLKVYEDLFLLLIICHELALILKVKNYQAFQHCYRLLLKLTMVSVGILQALFSLFEVFTDVASFLIFALQSNLYELLSILLIILR